MELPQPLAAVGETAVSVWLAKTMNSTLPEMGFPDE